MNLLAAITYIASPTGAGGHTLEDRMKRIDGLSEAEAKDILKRCVSMASGAKDEALEPVKLFAAVDGFHP